MEEVGQLISYVLLTSVVFLVISFLCMNVYFNIRKRIPVKVNCWFCNEWTKVHYDNRNCFECPTCLQYNGFNSDGDYNKSIPAQHDELLNQQVTAKVQNQPSLKKTGFCHICNNNQQLKVYQLANYVPLNEANFDAEIEHFQKQLEKAYKLCPKCDFVLKSTIRKQNSLLSLNFSQLRKKGLLLMDFNQLHNAISKKTRQPVIRTLLNFLLVSLACLNLSLTVMQLDIYKNIRKYIPGSVCNYLVSRKAVWMSSYKNILMEIGSNLIILEDTLLRVPYMNDVITFYNSLSHSIVIPTLLFKNVTIVCFLGFLLQFLSMILWKEKNNWKRLSIWSFLLLVHCLSSTKYAVYANSVQIFGSVIIIISVYLYQTLGTVKLKKLNRGRSRKISGVLNDHPHKREVLKTTPSPVDNSKENDQNLISYDTNSMLSTNSSCANTASISNNSFSSHNSLNSVHLNDDSDLGFNKLHLGRFNVKRSPIINVNIDRPKPVISPAKFKNDTQNSWVAGGFWKDTNNSCFMPCGFSNSRSSSQTSGFVSQTGLPDHRNYCNSSPSSANSFCGGFDSNSLFSEPTCFNSHNENYGNYFGRLPYYAGPKPYRTFYPVMNHEQMVYLSPSCLPSCTFSRNILNYDHTNCKSNISFGTLNSDKNNSFKGNN